MGDKNLEISQRRRQKMEKILAMLKNNIDNFTIVKDDYFFTERTGRGLMRQPDECIMVKVEPVTKRFAGNIGPDGDKIPFYGYFTREYLDGHAADEYAAIHLEHYYDASSFKFKKLGVIKTKQKSVNGRIPVKGSITDATEITVISPEWREDNGVTLRSRTKHVNAEMDLGKMKIYYGAKDDEQGADVVIDRIYNAITRAKQKDDAAAKKLSKLNLLTSAADLTADNQK